MIACQRRTSLNVQGQQVDVVQCKLHSTVGERYALDIIVRSTSANWKQHTRAQRVSMLHASGLRAICVSYLGKQWAQRDTWHGWQGVGVNIGVPFGLELIGHELDNGHGGKRLGL